MPELLTRRKDDVLIAYFASPNIVSDEVISQTGRELMALASQAEGEMLLDFRGVRSMSFSMLGRIVLMHKKCQANRTRVKMCNVSGSILKVFNIVRLGEVFSIHPSVDDALSAFSQSA